MKIDKLIRKLYKERDTWVENLVANSDLSTEELLKLYSYECCIKEGIIDYLLGDNISDDLKEFLLNKEDTLSYLYMEYMKDDTVNIYNEIERLISNLRYRFNIYSEASVQMIRTEKALKTILKRLRKFNKRKN